MSLSKIISIPGMSGLYKMIAQLRNGGFIVESFIDQKRIPVSSTQRIIMLEDIRIYTTEDEVPLNDVFLRMKEKNELCIAITPQTNSGELRSTLKQIVPEFDEERVHDSDIKKMFAWYVLLKDQIEKDPIQTITEDNADELSGSGKKAKKVSEKVAVAVDDSVEKKPKTKKTTKKEA